MVRHQISANPDYVLKSRRALGHQAHLLIQALFKWNIALQNAVCLVATTSLWAAEIFDYGAVPEFVCAVAVKHTAISKES
jgi:hypothetical protein